MSPRSCEWTNDPDLWKELALDQAKIFLWRADYAVPDCPTPGWFDGVVSDRMKALPGYAQAEKIVVIDHEGWSQQFLLSDPRVHVWDSTVADPGLAEHDRFHQYWFWFDWVREIEEYQQSLQKLIDVKSKSGWKFDLLLGRRKPWRDDINQIVNDSSLRQDVYMSYPGLDGNWVQGFDRDHGQDSTDRVVYHDRMTGNRSCFLPWKIYNQTFYSLVAETNHDRIFFSEKIAKPLLAGRIFLLFAAPGSLRVLKDLGYQTFGHIIDESYDEIKDHKSRWAAVTEQATALSHHDPKEIYTRAKSVLEHNQRLFLTQNWREKMIDEIKGLI